MSAADPASLVEGRRTRCLEAMASAGLDALVVGRPANIRYVSGARQLWTAGTRPFAPACVLIGATSDVHLLSTWDHGIPADIPHQNLYGLSWNPANYVTALQAIPGLGSARRVGVDGMTPLFAQLLPAAIPAAELTDGTRALLAARRIKTDEELAAIDRAVTVAEEALSAAVASLRPTSGAAELRGVIVERAAAYGVTTPAFVPAVSTTPDGATAIRVGLLVDGYLGTVGRTWPDHAAQWLAIRDAVTAHLYPGRAGADVHRAYQDAGGLPVPGRPLVCGAGLGFEPPIDGNERLEPGMVLTIHGHIDGYVAAEMVAITEDGHRLLTRAPYEP